MANRTSDNVPHTEARATTSIIIMLSVKREVQRHEFLQLPSNEITEKMNCLAPDTEFIRNDLRKITQKSIIMQW